jgi:hypothetical protein
MSSSDPDMAELTAGIVEAWYGYTLPASARGRAGAELAALITAFRRLSPPQFDTQAHQFAPLLEALADE